MQSLVSRGVGLALRESGSCLERLGMSMVDDYSFWDHISKHTTLVNFGTGKKNLLHVDLGRPHTCRGGLRIDRAERDDFRRRDHWGGRERQLRSVHHKYIYTGVTRQFPASRPRGSFFLFRGSLFERVEVYSIFGLFDLHHWSSV